MTPGATDDRIWNGADDDGSGTVALMALARAFANGPRPKRSLLFVWHAGEERGLLGSRYFADYPTVPLETIVAQLNIDMIGRNRDNKSSEANTVYLVGSDRISSELHEINREANRALPATVDARLRDERPGRSRAGLLSERSLQLRGQGHSDHLLHDRTACRLPCEHRRGVEDRVRQADAGSRSWSTRPPRGSPISIIRPHRDNRGRTGREGHALTRPLLIIFLTIFVNLIGFGIIIPLLPFYAETFGASPFAIGLLFAVFSLCQLIAAPILGDLSDRYGRRPILILSLAGTVVSFVMMALAQSFTMLFVARIVDGLSGGNISTARAYVADVTEPKDRARAYGLIGAAFGLGLHPRAGDQRGARARSVTRRRSGRPRRLTLVAMVDGVGRGCPRPSIARTPARACRSAISAR